jgi:hypothetical protein
VKNPVLHDWPVAWLARCARRLRTGVTRRSLPSILCWKLPRRHSPRQRIADQRGRMLRYRSRVSFLDDMCETVLNVTILFM